MNVANGYDQQVCICPLGARVLDNECVCPVGARLEPDGSVIEVFNSLVFVSRMSSSARAARLVQLLTTKIRSSNAHMALVYSTIDVSARS
jgi:hypothetical protein